VSSSVCTLTVYLPPFRGMSFHSSAPDSAILALPAGTESQDLQNIALFSSYMESNIDDWYQFANSMLGCDARNRDLRLMIGHNNRNLGVSVCSRTVAARHNPSFISRLNCHPTRFRAHIAGLVQVRQKLESALVLDLRKPLL